MRLFTGRSTAFILMIATIPLVMTGLFVFACTQQIRSSFSIPNTETDAIDYYLQTHKQPSWIPMYICYPTPKPDTKQLLHLTRFLGGPGTAMQVTVSPQGKVRFVRDVYNWALQNDGEGQLPQNKLAALRKDLQHDMQHDMQQLQLPPGSLAGTMAGSKAASWNDLVILSYYRKQNKKQKWTTCLTQVSKLPPSVKDLVR